jgi:hypothetical protein
MTLLFIFIASVFIAVLPLLWMVLVFIIPFFRNSSVYALLGTIASILIGIFAPIYTFVVMYWLKDFYKSALHIPTEMGVALIWISLFASLTAISTAPIYCIAVFISNRSKNKANNN